MTLADVALEVAPWVATALGIAAAIAAEQSFRFSNKGAPPDRWSGDFGVRFDFEHKEIGERAGRDCAREAAAASQAVATYLAAGAAVEATASSQHGSVAVALATVGCISAVPAAIRFLIARRSMAYTNAWYMRLRWALRRRYAPPEERAADDAAFARSHPKEDKLLDRHAEGGDQ